MEDFPEDKEDKYDFKGAASTDGFAQRLIHAAAANYYFTNAELSTYYSDLLDGSYDCVDRIVLNAHFPLCYSAGGFRFGGDGCTTALTPNWTMLI